MPSRLSVRLLFLLLSGAPALAAQGGPPVPPAVRAARAELQAGRPDSAITLLTAFFAATPDAVTGRLLLAQAYHARGQLEPALAAYLAVERPRPQRFEARVGAARVATQLGRTEEAFRLLAEVKGSGAWDMDRLDTIAELAPLRGDARWAAVHFQPADFTRPFVEPARILHEWVGETKGDQFSWIARGIGDATGDGVAEVVTSAPTYGAAGAAQGPGRVYLYDGRSGRLLWQWTGSGTEGAGTGLEGAGDVNHDGVPDVIAGAPGSGKAYVLSGRDGAVLHVLVGKAEDAFGQAAAGAGDQDGDGYADLLVGAPAGSGLGAGAGKAYLYSGKDGALLQVLDGEGAGHAFGSIVAGKKDGTRTPFLVGAPGAGAGGTGRVYVYPGLRQLPSFVLESDSTGAALGAMFTSVVGDVDRDGVPDLYASDYTNAARGPATGRVYVVSGATGRPLHALTGEHPGDGFGIGSAEAGDVNGDGYDDLTIGAWQYSEAAPSGGRIYVYSGRDGTLLRTLTGRVPGETLGFDATGVGDANGDGIPDLLVTSSWSNIRGFHTGRMYLIAGERAR